MALGVIGKLCARDVCRLCFTAYVQHTWRSMLSCCHRLDRIVLLGALSHGAVSILGGDAFYHIASPGASVEASMVSAVFGGKTMEASHIAINIEVLRAGRLRMEYSDILICGKLGGFWTVAQSS